MKLNLGCGSQMPDGWVNVDYALGARFAKIPFFRATNRRLGLFDLDWDERIRLHDLTKTFPWEDASVEVIYSSHMLEHLPREDGRRFLEQCHRVLRVGGIIRLVVPDLRHAVGEYVEGGVPADEFLQTLGVLYEHRGGRLKRRLSPFVQFPHKCMYDCSRLLELLQEIGFQTSARGAFDSDIDDIASVELEDRTKHAVIVEGRKPARSDCA
jgi:predicted SAM-dependent methyltransferase